MSSIFSDPFFRRGSTLLGGEVIEKDSAGNPIAGGEVVGQVKVFQDCNPSGDGKRYSNRLVYCVAARYKGDPVNDASSIAGTAYTFDSAAPLTNFTSKAANADVAAGKPVGVLDEYLTGALRTDDIVWLVVKGPTSIRKGSNAAVAAGAGVEIGASGTAGQVIPVNTGVNVGNSIAGVEVTGSQGTLLRINKTCNFI
jgi:hypothetical protein